MDVLREILSERLLEPRFWVGLGVLGMLLGQLGRVVVAEVVRRSVRQAVGRSRDEVDRAAIPTA